MAKSADGQPHGNTCGSQQVYRGFFVRNVFVKSAYLVSLVMEDEPEHGGWETKHWHAPGEPQSDHYSYDPQHDKSANQDEPVNPRGAPGIFTPIVHRRSTEEEPVAIEILIQVAFWPRVRRGEPVDVLLRIPQLNFMKLESATPDSYLHIFRYVVPKAPLDVARRDLTMFVSAMTTSSCVGLGSIRLDEFELMTVVNRPIATFESSGEYSKYDRGVTNKRVGASVAFLGPKIGKSSELYLHNLVHDLVVIAGNANLERSGDVPIEYAHPVFNNLVGGAWPLLANLEKSGECQAIVRLSLHMLWQIGIVGNFKRVNVWAQPVPDTVEEKSRDYSNKVGFHENEGSKGGLPTYIDGDINGKSYNDCLFGLVAVDRKDPLILGEVRNESTTPPP